MLHACKILNDFHGKEQFAIFINDSCDLAVIFFHIGYLIFTTPTIV